MEKKPGSKAGFGQPFAPPFRPPFPGRVPRVPGQPPTTPGGPKAPVAPPKGPEALPRPSGLPAIHGPGPAEDVIDLVTESILNSRTPEVIPLLLRRCITDVWTKPQLLGTTKRELFRGAVAISLASLQKSGRIFVNPRGVVTLTPKGREQNTVRQVAVPDRTLKEAAFRRIVSEVKLERPSATTLPPR